MHETAVFSDGCVDRARSYATMDAIMLASAALCAAINSRGLVEDTGVDRDFVDFMIRALFSATITI